MQKLPFTGLPHVRVDDTAHDPIVLDPGTLIGLATGSRVGSGTFYPAMMNTGIGTDHQSLKIAGSAEASTWGLPTTSSGVITCGIIKPLGVVFAPAYSAILETAFTNYKRQHSVAFLTDYVIQVPATNSEEVAIFEGDVVMLGTGQHYGIGWSSPYSTHLQAGRYARYDSTAYLAPERVVGRCLKRILLGTNSAATTGDLLSDSLNSTFVLSQQAKDEFQRLDMVETVPGLGLSGSGTKGVPAFLLGARCDASKNFWALTILIRL